MTVKHPLSICISPALLCYYIDACHRLLVKSSDYIVSCSFTGALHSDFILHNKCTWISFINLAFIYIYIYAFGFLFKDAYTNTHTHLHLHSIHISDICEPAYMLYAELLPHFYRTDNFWVVWAPICVWPCSCPIDGIQKNSSCYKKGLHNFCIRFVLHVDHKVWET